MEPRRWLHHCNDQFTRKQTRCITDVFPTLKGGRMDTLVAMREKKCWDDLQHLENTYKKINSKKQTSKIIIIMMAAVRHGSASAAAAAARPSSTRGAEGTHTQVWRCWGTANHSWLVKESLSTALKDAWGCPLILNILRIQESIFVFPQ